MWNGLCLCFCHGYGIDWSNRIVGVVLLIGYWKDGNQLMIATNKKSVIWMGMNDADVSVNKSTSLVTIFADDDSHSEINWHRLISALRSRKGNDRFAIAKEVAQNGLIDNVRSIVGKVRKVVCWHCRKHRTMSSGVTCKWGSRIVDSFKKWRRTSRSHNVIWRTVWSKRLSCRDGVLSIASDCIADRCIPSALWGLWCGKKRAASDYRRDFSRSWYGRLALLKL